MVKLKKEVFLFMEFEKLIDIVKEEGTMIDIDEVYWNLSYENNRFILLDDDEFRKDFIDEEELKQFKINGRKFIDIVDELDEEDLII